MKKTLLALLMLLPAIMGSAKNYKFNVEKPVTGVENNSTVDVKLMYSPTAANVVTYSSDASVAPLRIVSNPDGVVVITCEVRGQMPKTSDVIIYYNSPITTLTLQGTGDIDAPAISSKGALQISNNGTGDVEIGSCNVASLKIHNGGTGDVDIKSGSCSSLEINNPGTGDVECRLSSSKAIVSNPGTGDVELSAPSASIEIDNFGTGIVDVKGRRPASVVIQGNAKHVKIKK